MEKIAVYTASFSTAMCLAILTLYFSPRDPAQMPATHGQSPGSVREVPTSWAKVELVLDRILAGQSYSYNRRPVLEVIRDRLPTTLAITIPGILVGALLGFGG